jgi:NAD(P)-dependent dehydrogenase (short-subunit alcohol dehydrogenase family)
MSHWDMKDKVVVVTGGTSGIGRGAAFAMAAAGARWLRAADARKRGPRWLPRSKRQGVRRALSGLTLRTRRILRALPALRRRAMGDSTSPSTMPGSS